MCVCVFSPGRGYALDLSTILPEWKVFTCNLNQTNKFVCSLCHLLAVIHLTPFRLGFLIQKNGVNHTYCI